MLRIIYILCIISSVLIPVGVQADIEIILGGYKPDIEENDFVIIDQQSNKVEKPKQKATNKPIKEQINNSIQSSINNSPQTQEPVNIFTAQSNILNIQNIFHKYAEYTSVKNKLNSLNFQLNKQLLAYKNLYTKNLYKFNQHKSTPEIFTICIINNQHQDINACIQTINELSTKYNNELLIITAYYMGQMQLDTILQNHKNKDLSTITIKEIYNNIQTSNIQDLIDSTIAYSILIN